MLFLSGGCVGFLFSHPHRKEEINFNPLEASVLSEKTEAYRYTITPLSGSFVGVWNQFTKSSAKGERLLVLEPINYTPHSTCRIFVCVFRQLRRDGISTNGISCVELNCCSCSSPGREPRLFIRAISWWCFDLFVSNLSVCWASPQQFIKATVLRCALGRECLDHRKYILVVCVCVFLFLGSGSLARDIHGTAAQH